MKYILLILGLSVLLMSCTKEEEVEYAKGKSMTAKLDGNLWRALKPTGSSSNGMYIISGKSKVGHTITLALSGVYEGEFSLSPISSSYAEYIPADEDEAKYTTLGGENSSGKIIITKIDRNARTATGTFYFTANQIGSHSIKNISAGEFENIEYTYIAPNPANNMLVAKLNGSQLTCASVTASAFSSSNQMQISGTDGLKTITITLPATITPGTYTIDGTTYNLAYQEGNDGYLTLSGTITVNSHNTGEKTISGTFSFNTQKASDSSVTVDITQGSFDVVYTLY